jgi:hypothetical protein
MWFLASSFPGILIIMNIQFMFNTCRMRRIRSTCLGSARVRTCGCCSHEASFIYYLSFARFQSDPLKKPGCSLDRVLVSLNKDELSDDDTDKDDAVDIPTQILFETMI